MNNKKNIVFIDIETTGDKNHEIVQLAIIRVDQDGQEIRRWSAYFNTNVQLKWHAVKRLGINNKFLSKYDSFQESIEAMRIILKDGILVGHNIKGFDLKVINKAFAKAGYVELENEIYDTLHMARYIKKHKQNFEKSNKLSDLARQYKIAFDENKAHCAKYDVEITKNLFYKLDKKCPEAKYQIKMNKK